MSLLNQVFPAFSSKPRAPKRPSTDSCLMRLAALYKEQVMLAIDLETRHPLPPVSQAAGSRMLILTAARTCRHSSRILENVAEAIISQKALLGRPDPADIKRLFQSHLSLERRFFDDPDSGLALGDYQGYLVNNMRVYPLHEALSGTCYVYRQGHLLEFRIDANHFVQLLPGDLFLLAKPDDMQLMVRSKSLKHLHRLLKQECVLLADIPRRRGVKRLQDSLNGMILTLAIVPKTPVSVWQKPQMVRLAVLAMLGLVAAAWFGAVIWTQFGAEWVDTLLYGPLP